MATPVPLALTIRRLEWLSSRPWTEAETLEVSRTNCRRMSIREGACIGRLVECAPQDVRVDVSAKRRLLRRELKARTG